ncbi:hypothetical protein [Microbacterium sp. SL75]|uniref:hypothetical protein n=1 Tax=Microbacterium sp. SL75 TaxID=2995140 RepID=UPI00226F51E6|nr:hypothetical protein [Microbacterium sp. SL75]WAC68915.1 hypothetical protein OVA17_15205 [Microbacterium sp. SL75]
MTRYDNGRAPLSDLVYLGPDFYLPAGTAARWAELRRLGVEKYGVLIYVTPGWNGYRPLDVQVQYREELGIWAAVPGRSSHGLTYQGRDCAAIDVNNWRALAPGNESLAWGRFVALCRLVGFTVDFVTPREEWHIGDFDPFTIPAFAAIAINPATTAKPEEDYEMADLYIFDSGAQFLETLGGHLHWIADPGEGGRLTGVRRIEHVSDRLGKEILLRHSQQDDRADLVRMSDPADASVYLLNAGSLRPLSDPASIGQFKSAGARDVMRLSRAEVDNLLAHA